MRELAVLELDGLLVLGQGLLLEALGVDHDVVEEEEVGLFVLDFLPVSIGNGQGALVNELAIEVSK